MTTSDLTIPIRAAIQARIADERHDAIQAHDEASVRCLDNLTRALEAGIRFCWAMDDLLIESASMPNTVYTVSGGACNCKARGMCKHLKLFDILIDIFDTEYETRDQDADQADAAADLLTTRLIATAQQLDAMRRAQGRALVPPDTAPGDDLPDDIPPNPRRMGVRLATARKKSAYFTSAFYLAA